MLTRSEDKRSRRLLASKYRFLKPLIDFWTWISHEARRKPRPVEVFLEITLT